MRHHSHDHEKAFEGRAVRRYDVLARRVLRGFYRRTAADVARAAPRDATVLDIGTGPGVLLMELAKRRPDLRLTGVDLSEDMIAAAARNLGDTAAVRTADVAELPFDAEAFDLVVSSFSTHHWENPETGAAEAARVLRTGGRFLVYDFERAPFEALRSPARFGGVERTRFRTGLGPLLRCFRFEATAE